MLDEVRSATKELSLFLFHSLYYRSSSVKIINWNAFDFPAKCILLMYSTQWKLLWLCLFIYIKWWQSGDGLFEALIFICKISYSFPPERLLSRWFLVSIPPDRLFSRRLINVCSLRHDNIRSNQSTAHFILAWLHKW